MAEDLVSLGFAFSAGNADTEINKLIASFNNLDEKSQSAKNALGKLFGGEFVARIDTAKKAIGKFNAGLLQTANFAKKATASLKILPTQIANVSADKIKPVPAAVIESLRTYSESAKTAAEAMTRLKDIPAKITPAPMQKFGKEIKQVQSNTTSLFAEFQRVFSSGTVFMFFRNSTVEAVKFGEEIAHITSLTMDYDPTKMRTGILNVSSELGNATKVAEATYYAFSSGVRGGEDHLVKFTADMSKLATLIRAGVTPTVDAATSAMNAYNLTAKDSGELVDLFYAIVKQGKAHGEQLASGLGQVISTAATAGVTLDEMGASVASLTKVMQTRNAITYFNNMLSKMIKPTKECRLAAEKLGIELGLEALKAKGFAGMMQEIHDKTKGSQQAILSMFPDLRGQRAALQLLNKGWGDFQNQLKFFANKSGVADAAMEKLSDDINFQLSVIPNTFAKIRIAVGDLLVSTLTLGGALTPIITGFNRMGEGGQKFFAAIALIAGGYAMLRGVQFAHRTLQAVEIRNNEILSAQRDKEAQQRMAIAAATKAQAAASTAANAANGATGVSGTVSAASAGPNPAMAAAMKQQQEYNALKLKLASESTIAAAARAKETEAIYQQNLALAQAAAMKKAETAETAELTVMLEKDAAWRAAMTSQNQSYFASISKQGIAERELAAATLERATADRVAAVEAAKKAAIDSTNAHNAMTLAKLEMQKAMAAKTSAVMYEKEVIAIARQSAMENMQTAAIKRSNMTRTQRIALIAQEMNDRAHNANLIYMEAEADYAKAKATGNATAAEEAYKNMIATKTAFVNADNKAEKWNNILLAEKNGLIVKNNALMAAQIKASKASTAANAANGTSGIFSALASGTGFIGGFGRDGIKAMAQWKNALKWTTGAGGIFPTLASGMKVLSAGIGKFAAVALKILSPMNLMIAGAIAAVGGLVDVLTSKGDSWSEKVGNSRVVSKIGDWLYDFFTGALTEAKRIQHLFEMSSVLQDQIATLQDWKRKSVMQFVDTGAMPQQDQYKLISQGFNNALKALQSMDYRTAVGDVNRLGRELAQMKKTVDTTPAMLKANLSNYLNVLSQMQTEFNVSEEKIQEYRSKLTSAKGGGLQAVWDEILKDASKGHTKTMTFQGATYDIGNYVLDFNMKYWNQLEEQLKQAQKEAEDKSEKLSTDMEKAQAKVEKFHQKALQYADMMRNYINKSRDALASVSGIIEKQQFAMLTPDQKIAKQTADIARYKKEAFDALNNRDGGAFKQAFQSMVDAFNVVDKDAETKINKYKSLQGKMKEDSFDYLLKSLQTVPQKVAAMRQRAQELYRESGGQWMQNAQGQWNFQVPQGANTDLEASYNKAKMAIGMQIQALQEEINAKNKLAQAEQRANENTLRLIQSMDKFKSTTATAVNAYSLEAQKLQSRSFATPTRVQPVTTAQTSLSNSNAQMQTLMQQAQQMIAQYQAAAAAREQAEAAKRAKLQQDLVDAFNDTELAMKNFEDHLDKIGTLMEKAANTVAKAMGDQNLINEVKNIHNSIKNVSTVTY